jgi:lysozyme family protein
MSKTRFDACLAEVLRHEGGYVDHPADPGGATNMGITHQTLARWRKVSPWWNLAEAEVRTLAREEAAAIYKAEYWDICRAGEMPAGVDLALFDFAVNSGPDRAIRTLQRVLNVASDGIAGPRTLAAVTRADARTVVEALCDSRLDFLKGLSTFATFGRGWSNRVAAVRAAALASAKTITIGRGEKTMDMLAGYKTYIVATIMLLAGVAQILGVELPSLEGGAAGSLILEALALIFLRKGLKDQRA